MRVPGEETRVSASGKFPRAQTHFSTPTKTTTSLSPRPQCDSTQRYPWESSSRRGQGCVGFAGRGRGPGCLGRRARGSVAWMGHHRTASGPPTSSAMPSFPPEAAGPRGTAPSCKTQGSGHRQAGPVPRAAGAQWPPRSTRGRYGQAGGAHAVQPGGLSASAGPAAPELASKPLRAPGTPGRRADASPECLGLSPACGDPEMPLSPAGQAPAVPGKLCRWDGREGWREPGKPVPGPHPHSSPAGVASPGHQPGAGWAAGPSSPERPPCSQLCRSGTTEGRGHTPPRDRRPSCPS